MLHSVLAQTRARRREQLQADVRRALLHYEARLGGEIFGPVPKGVRREFFCLDRHTWVWHEEWKDERGKPQMLTTRYDVRPSGIVKSQGNHVYQALTDEERRNFHAAVQLYGYRVGTELRRLAQQAA